MGKKEKVPKLSLPESTNRPISTLFLKIQTINETMLKNVQLCKHGSNKNAPEFMEEVEQPKKKAASCSGEKLLVLQTLRTDLCQNVSF